MKRRLLHLLLIIVPLQAREPNQIRRHLPYSYRIQPKTALSSQDLRAELRRLQKHHKLDREFNLEKKRKLSWFDILVRAAILGVCGWLAWKNRYEVIAALLGGEVFLRHQIRVGNLPCEGREVPISDSFKVKQVLVARQSGPTCGAEAFKNAAFTVDALDNNDNNLGRRLCDKRLVEILLKRRRGAEGPWRDAVKRHRRIAIGERRNANGDWFDEGDIEAINDHEARYHSATQPSFNSDRISVCSTPSLLGGRGSDHHVHDARRHAVARPFTHGFVLGDMQPDGSSAGHWIAVVLHQRDGRNKEYIIADSMNGLAWRGDDRVKRLLQVLEGRATAEAFSNSAS